MSALREQDRWPVIKWLAGLLVSVTFIWVSNLQASYIRLVQDDIKIKNELAQKAEKIATHEALLGQIIPQLVRIENKLDRTAEFIRKNEN